MNKPLVVRILVPPLLLAAALRLTAGAPTTAAPATAVAGSAACRTPPAPTQAKDLHGITPPSYLAFLPTSESVQGATYYTWDEQQFRLGGSGQPDELS